MCRRVNDEDDGGTSQRTGGTSQRTGGTSQRNGRHFSKERAALLKGTGYILSKHVFVFLRRKIDFCLKRPKMVQMGPNGQKWSKICYIDRLGPFGTTSGHWQACHVRPFLVPNGPFLDAPRPGMEPGEGLNDLNPPCHMYKEVPGPFRV